MFDVIQDSKGGVTVRDEEGNFVLSFRRTAKVENRITVYLDGTLESVSCLDGERSGKFVAVDFTTNLSE